MLAELESVAGRGERFRVQSEEAGDREHGAEFPLVLVDPVDGSLNAKQGLPVYALMLTLLDGPALGDARLGYVLNLATGEEWSAIRGQGVRRNGEPVLALSPRRGRTRFELVMLESSPRSVLRAAPLLERSAKLRVLGCMALGIVHAATGGADVFVAPFAARAFDMSASLLMVRELGGVATDLDGNDVGAVRAGLDSRTSLVCAADAADHRDALAALRT